MTDTFGARIAFSRTLVRWIDVNWGNMRLRVVTILLSAALLLSAASGATPSVQVAKTPLAVTGGGVLSPLADGYVFRTKTVQHHFAIDSGHYDGGTTIPEPVLVALLGAALLVFSKLLRKRLRRS